MEVIGEVGLGSQPSLQEAGSSRGWGEELTDQDPGPPPPPLLALGSFAQRDSPQSTSTYLIATGAGGGRAGPALAMLGGHTKESRGRGVGRADSASWPFPSCTQIGIGVLSSSCNHFYLILLRVVHGRIYLLSDNALQFGLSTSEETVF